MTAGSTVQMAAIGGGQRSNARYPMHCFLGFLAGSMLTLGEPSTVEKSPVAVNSIATPVRELRVGPVVSDSAGKSASLVGMSYEKTPEGYRPTLVAWELGPQGKKLGEFNYELPIPPEKYPGYPFVAACLWDNGDIAVITLTDQYQLIRLNRLGKLIHIRESGRNSSGSESFAAILPDKDSGLWFGTHARLYHLDSKGEVLLDKEFAFDEYTSLAHLAQPRDSNGVLACGTAKHSDGPWQGWVARISSDGKVLKKVSIPGMGPLEAMVALPDDGVAVLQVEGDKDQRTIKILVFDADLDIVGSTSWAGPTVEVLHCSMAFVGDELLVFTQGRWQHHLIRAGKTGEITARHPIAAGIVPFPRSSLAVRDGELLIAGRGKEDDGSVRMSDLQIEAYEVVRQRDEP